MSPFLLVPIARVACNTLRRQCRPMCAVALCYSKVFSVIVEISYGIEIVSGVGRRHSDVAICMFHIFIYK